MKTPIKTEQMRVKGTGFETTDAVILTLLLAGVLIILFPFFNMIAISFTSYKEYMQSAWVFFPKEPTLNCYRDLFVDAKILIGYKTTMTYLALGVPINLLLSLSLAYALFRKDWPGRRLILTMVLITMIFHGGIVPTYLVMKSLNLTNTVWAVVFANGMSTFNMILIYNYFCSLPDSLIESAALDNASEWTILFRIVIPLASPIIATVVLFVSVQIWNEYFMSMIFLRSNKWQSLQQVLRSIVIDAQTIDTTSSYTDSIENKMFADGVKMAAVVVTMLPIMAVYPFLQRYFTKGIMVGAIKA